MDKMLLLWVHFLDDRYHGEGDGGHDGWPPSPARLFQALVAGSALGARLPEPCAEALRWLEERAGAPEIRAPRGRPGRAYRTYVPNNDLDAQGGDPARIAEIRVAKRVRPRHIDARHPVVYGWRCACDAESDRLAAVLCAMAENLYQLGRGLDMAWARAEWLDAEAGVAALEAACGEVWRPTEGAGGTPLPCPHPGSLRSLILRFEAGRGRFSTTRDGRKVLVDLTNPPKPSFRQVGYAAAPAWRLFDLRAEPAPAAAGAGAPRGAFRPWSQDRVVALVERVRDGAAARLGAALPGTAGQIERLLVGRGAGPLDLPRRVRLVPLPSIGHALTNRAIRRVLLLVPPDCPLPVGDLDWALSGLLVEGAGAGDTRLVRSDDPAMLRNYGVETGERYRLWQTVTPVVLPQSAARRRIDPGRQHEQAKPGRERAAEEQRAADAVIQALRHAEVRARVESVRVQREPFSGKGARAEPYAVGTRFAKERLWHCEIRLASGVEGPLLLGDGRWLGLGLLAPVREHPGRH